MWLVNLLENGRALAERIGKNLDRHHQHEANDFGLDGQRAAEQSNRHE